MVDSGMYILIDLYNFEHLVNSNAQVYLMLLQFKYLHVFEMV